MKVEIDGIEYVPTSSKTVTVHNVEYSSVSNWLDNVRAELTHAWVDIINKDSSKIQTPEAVKAMDRIHQFEIFVKDYLGFVEDDSGYHLKEIEGWTLEDYGKIKEDDQ